MTQATDAEREFYEAKATYYRDFATIFGIIFGFLSVALFVGGVNTNPFSSEFVAYQHPALSIPTLVMGIVLIVLARKMAEYNERVVRIRRSAMEKSKSSN